MTSKITIALALLAMTGCSDGNGGKGDEPGTDDTGTSTNYTPDAIDDDGDGYSELEGDCDDNDRHTNPGEVEDPYNGIDDDCDESTPDDDLDGDGVDIDEDCDDTDPSITPNATEVPYNGIDDDCDKDTPDDDLDGDGFSVDEDCDDDDPNAYPGNAEDFSDGIDNDCDDEIDERFTVETVDSSSGDVGYPSAIQVDSAGVAHIVYAEPDFGYIYHVERSSNGNWGYPETVIADSGWSGEWLDIAIDSADNVQVAFTWVNSSWTSRELDFIYMDASGWWSSVYYVDNGSDTGSNDVGAYVDIKIDSAGLPSFAYLDATRGVPVLADYTTFGNAIYIDADYNLWDASMGSGFYATLGLDSSDYDHVAYYNIGLSSDVRYSSLANGGAYSEVIDPDTGIYIDLEVRNDNTPCIAYLSTGGNDLRYACRDNGSSWSIETVDSSGSVGGWASLAFLSDGTPYIAYFDESNSALKVASLTGSNGNWDVSTLDDSGDVGYAPYITVDHNDIVHISYYDAGNGALKYAVGN